MTERVQTPPVARYYADRLRDGALAYQRCEACKYAVHPPRVLCPACGAQSLYWAESAGSGVIYSATTVVSRTSEPYAIVLVDLDEGFRMMSRLTCAPDAVGIGDRVVLDLVAAKTADDVPLPCFTETHR